MMDMTLIREIEKKTEKSEVEHVLLKYYYTFSIISEILVDESKLHISSEGAICKIREQMNDNL